MAFTKNHDKNSWKGNQVIPIINYSDKPVIVKLNSKYQNGTYNELFTNAEYVLKGDDINTLKP